MLLTIKHIALGGETEQRNFNKQLNQTIHHKERYTQSRHIVITHTAHTYCKQTIFTQINQLRNDL